MNLKRLPDTSLLPLNYSECQRNWLIIMELLLNVSIANALTLCAAALAILSFRSANGQTVTRSVMWQALPERATDLYMETMAPYMK